jgi:hypothetical protein
MAGFFQLYMVQSDAAKADDFRRQGAVFYKAGVPEPLVNALLQFLACFN